MENADLIIKLFNSTVKYQTTRIIHKKTKMAYINTMREFLNIVKNSPNLSSARLKISMRQHSNSQFVRNSFGYKPIQAINQAGIDATDILTSIDKRFGG